MTEIEFVEEPNHTEKPTSFDFITKTKKQRMYEEVERRRFREDYLRINASYPYKPLADSYHIPPCPHDPTYAQELFYNISLKPVKTDRYEDLVNIKFSNQYDITQNGIIHITNSMNQTELYETNNGRMFILAMIISFIIILIGMPFIL